MKISREEREEIRKRYARYQRILNRIRKDNITALAKEFGVSSARIFYIVNVKEKQKEECDDNI